MSELTEASVKRTITEYLSAKAAIETWHTRLLMIGGAYLKNWKYGGIESWEFDADWAPPSVDQLTIRYSRWNCGDHDYETVTFPTAWLWMEWAAVKVAIAERQAAEAAADAKRQAEELAARDAQTREQELKQLSRLKEKYER